MKIYEQDRRRQYTATAPTATIGNTGATYNSVATANNPSKLDFLKPLLSQDGKITPKVPSGSTGATYTSVGTANNTNATDFSKAYNLQNATVIPKGTSGSISAANNSLGTAISKTATATPKKTPNYLNAAPVYMPSTDVTSAQSAYQSWLNDTPDAYTSQYESKLQGLWNEYNNRSSFTYDMENDPLYQQYKNQYTQQAKNSMRDTMANAAALTGGYGSSYASTAGGQAYQNTMSSLNNLVPELYAQAASQYNAEGDQMLNSFTALKGLEDSAYGRYQDSLADYYNRLDALNTNYTNLNNSDFARYQQNVANWNSEYDNQQENEQFNRLHPAKKKSSSTTIAGNKASNSTLYTINGKTMTSAQYQAWIKTSAGQAWVAEVRRREQQNSQSSHGGR